MNQKPTADHRKDILDRAEEIKNWIAENQTKAFICKQLNCRPSTLETYLNRLNIEYKGNRGRKGKLRKYRYKDSSYYTTNKQTIGSYSLKRKLLRDGIKEYRCELCGKTTWLNNPIPLELHHVDGNHFNNELSNLKLLCPNCHAIQPNNSGAAKKKKE